MYAQHAQGEYERVKLQLRQNRQYLTGVEYSQNWDSIRPMATKKDEN